MQTFTEDQAKAIKGLVQEVSNSMTRMEAEKDLIKEAVDAIHEEHKIDKKLLKNLCKIYHKQNFHEVKRENEDTEESYAFLFKEIE